MIECAERIFHIMQFLSLVIFELRTIYNIPEMQNSGSDSLKLMLLEMQCFAFELKEAGRQILTVQAGVGLPFLLDKWEEDYDKVFKAWLSLKRATHCG